MRMGLWTPLFWGAGRIEMELLPGKCSKRRVIHRKKAMKD